MNLVRSLYLCYMFTVAWLSSETVMDNSGKEFLLVFLDGRRNNTPVQLTMTTISNNTAHILVQTPIWKSPLALNSTFKVRPGEMLNVNLSNKIWLTENIIEDKSVLVTSTDDIVLYASQSQFGLSDSAIIYPVKTIGRTYVSISGPDNVRIGCVAANDNTTVTVTSPTGIDLNFEGKNMNQIQLKFNKYQTFLIRSTDDNTGSVIESDHPIACFSGSSYSKKLCVISSGAADFLNTQLLPVEYWSSKYLIVSNPNYAIGAGDYIRVVTFYDYTHIGIERNGLDICMKYEVQSGCFKEFFIPSGETAVIHSNNPIQIGQISCSSGRKRLHGDPRLFIPIADNQFLPAYIFPTPLTNLRDEFTYELLVVTETNLTSSLILDGVNLSFRVQWTDIDSIGFSFCVMELDKGVHSLQSLSPGKFGGYMLGYFKRSEFGTVIGRMLTPTGRNQVTEITFPSKTPANEMNLNTPGELFVIHHQDKQLPKLSRLVHFHRVSSMGCLMWCVCYEQCIVVSYNKVQELCVLYDHSAVCLTEVDPGGTIYMKKVVYNVLYNT